MWFEWPPQILFLPSDRFPDGMAYTQGCLSPVGDSEENARPPTTGGLQRFWLWRRGGPIDLRCLCGRGRSIVRKRFARDRHQGALRAGGTKRQRKIVGSYVLATRFKVWQSSKKKMECGTARKSRRGQVAWGASQSPGGRCGAGCGAMRAEHLCTTVLRRIDRASATADAAPAGWRGARGTC